MASGTANEEKVHLTMNNLDENLDVPADDALDGDHRRVSITGLDKFAVTTEKLKELMKVRGLESVTKLDEEYKGINGLIILLKSSATDGISSGADVENRAKLFGKNFIPPKPAKSFWRLVWEALEDTILRILVVAALISLVLGMVFESVETGWIEPFAILIAVAIVSLVTALNDWQKEKQFRELQNKIDSNQEIAVIRDGNALDLKTTELVVGDIVQLKYGDLIPADGIILQSNDLKVDESSLTGESDDVKKSTEKDPALLSGTHVMEGSCKCIITAVGPNSQSGIIFALLGATKAEKTDAPEDGEMQEVDLADGGKGKKADKEDDEEEEEGDKSILQNKLTKLTLLIGWLGVGAAVITTLAILIRFCIETYAIKKEPWDNKHLQSFLGAFINGLTILVVAIPEGLPLAVTIALAYSVKRMLIDNNLVRHLDACETMGNATAICSDKTGTLTTNRMTVVEAYLKGKHFQNVTSDETSAELINNLDTKFKTLLCKGISINSGYSTRLGEPEHEQGLPSQLGNKTECALLGLVIRVGEMYTSYRSTTPEESFVHVYTFNSTRKSMSTVIPNGDNGYILFSKGASEMILSKCTTIIGEDGEKKEFSPKDSEEMIKSVIEPMASNGLRTIGLAYKEFPLDQGAPDWENEAESISGLTCIGVVGIEDPVRPEVPPSIIQCQRAGITVRMVTGDNVNTARSIAFKCGIMKPEDDFLVLEGKEFNEKIRDANGKVSQDLVDEIWPKLRVMARSSPEDKYTLVSGMINSKLGSREIVAVTGDGTNDGPALKKADVGFAMGIQGTDVAKEASDIILTDDNFTSIVKAVMWGRNVYDSISKFIQFQLTVNLVAILTCIIGALIVKQTPLTSIQLLWVNLIMDTFASLALATEMPTPELLERKPYGRTKPLISRSMLRFIIGHGIYQLIVMMVLSFYCYDRTWFDIPYGFEDGRDHNSPPTQHLAIVFNSFVMMQIFNEINARKVHGERNVFKGIFTNKLFVGIFIGTFVVQIILVEAGGRFFQVTGLSVEQWMWCIFFGFSELIVHQLVVSVPLSIIPKTFRFGQKGVSMDATDSGMGRVLWMRSLNRLQSQVRVVHAFRSNLDPNHRTMNVISPAVMNSLLVPLGASVPNQNGEASADGNLQHVDAV
jgi:Ca2+ transporting ATPase